MLNRGSQSEIQAVTFDVGGTLIQPWPSVGHIYSQVAERHGMRPVSAEVINRRFSDLWRARADFDYSRAGWFQIVQETFAGAPQIKGFDQLFAELYERFARPQAWRIYPDVRPALDELQKRDTLRLGIISNWDERLRPLLQQLDLSRYFQIVVISCETGAIKPSPLIFQAALEQLQVPPQCIIHVGDSYEADYQGALWAGLRSIWVRRGFGKADPWQISSLSTLPTALKNF